MLLMFFWLNTNPDKVYNMEDFILFPVEGKVFIISQTGRNLSVLLEWKVHILHQYCPCVCTAFSWAQTHHSACSKAAELCLVSQTFLLSIDVCVDLVATVSRLKEKWLKANQLLWLRGPCLWGEHCCCIILHCARHTTTLSNPLF